VQNFWTHINLVQNIAPVLWGYGHIAWYASSTDLSLCALSPRFANNRITNFSYEVRTYTPIESSFEWVFPHLYNLIKSLSSNRLIQEEILWRNKSIFPSFTVHIAWFLHFLAYAVTRYFAPCVPFVLGSETVDYSFAFDIFLWFREVPSNYYLMLRNK
jgi:hypothetical protein